MFHLQRVLLLLLVSLILIIPNSSIAAPVPIPKTNRTEEQKLIGIWQVKDTNYLEVWEFKPNGVWHCYTSQDSYMYSSVCLKGTWEVRHTNYLYINYNHTTIVHKLGSGKHRKYHTKYGHLWNDLSLTFVKRIR